MCGIVGYIGKQAATPVLMDGLKRLEYRGYDSAGLAVIEADKLKVYKKAGKIRALEQMLDQVTLKSHIGIAHTRWATHGEPTDINAHPHVDSNNRIALVHNGIIENYLALKRNLAEKGHQFKTETDTEILVHLIDEFLDGAGSLVEALRQALSQVKGTYGLAIIDCADPTTLVAARKGSPLLIGAGDGEYIVASDSAAVISHTRDVVYLEDGELAVIKCDDLSLKTLDDVAVSKKLEHIQYDLEKIEKGGYAHFMFKEIIEQPQTIADTMRGRLLEEEGTALLGGLRYELESLAYARRILITACGTSWHAALIGEYLLEEYARLPVEVEYASEFRYRDPVLDEGTVVIVISQSGETADTLAALREAKRKRCKVYGICNVVGSTIARESDAGVYLHAGPEIGVASTKAFTSQVTVMTLITLLLSRMKTLSAAGGRRIVQEMLKIPEKINRVLANNAAIQAIAEIYQNSRNFLYLGRGYNFPVALEGALKLKEISYIHAEGYPAAEMKHGPIALIDENMPVVFIATQDSTYDKIMSNIQEVRARKGRIIAIATEGDHQIQNMADHVIYVPDVQEPLIPLVTIIPLQLLAYHIAVLRGCNVDQPRNLAKSVTVE